MGDRSTSSDGGAGKPAPRAAVAALPWRVTLVLAVLSSACSGPQSALSPAGRDAERIFDLFWWMAGGAVLVWAAVVLLAIYVIRVHSEPQEERSADLLIIGGGVVVPTLTLTVLVTYGVSLMPSLMAPPPEPGLHVAVSGEQWWWRIRYEPVDGPPVESANELRLPVGEPVTFTVTSPDVIHSFWIPSLGGKMDMIPGRRNRLTLEPTQVGRFRGVCAEYCGTSHALMAFPVEVMEREDFDAWLRSAREPALPPATGAETVGRELFLSNGCGACHTVRGTPADGVVGPDLTHVGSRTTLGAGLLPNEPEAMRQWIARPESVKPGVHMPGFGVVGSDEVAAMAAYLQGLQ